MKSLDRLKASVETPAKQAVTIAVIALIVALAALAFSSMGGGSRNGTGSV